MTRHLEFPSLLAAVFVLISLTTSLGKEYERRSIDFDLEVLKFKKETIYTPSKSTYFEEVEKQKESQACLPNCTATRKDYLMWEILGIYEQEKSSGPSFSHEESVR